MLVSDWRSCGTFVSVEIGSYSASWLSSGWLSCGTLLSEQISLYPALWLSFDWLPCGTSASVGTSSYPGMEIVERVSYPANGSSYMASSSAQVGTSGRVQVESADDVRLASVVSASLFVSSSASRKVIFSSWRRKSRNVSVRLITCLMEISSFGCRRVAVVIGVADVERRAGVFPVE